MAIVINGTGTIAGVSATGITTAPTNATDSTKLPLAGGTLTGNVTGVKLGLGVAPTNLLHTHGAAGNTYQQFTNNTTGSGTGDGVIIGLAQDDSMLRIENRENAHIRFNTDNAERMRILNDGKVGIGTTTPAVTLELAGNGGAIRLPNGGELQFGNSDNLIIGNSGSNYLAFKANNAERMRITDNGTIGIGNTIPNLFSVNANNLVVGTGTGSEGMTIYSGNSSAGNIFFADSADNNEETRGGISYQHNGDKMQFRVNDANRMMIDSSGNVGITENTPIRKLHILGSAGNSSIMLIHMDADTANGEGGIQFKGDSTNDDRRIKAAIIFKRDDPGTRGTGNLRFRNNGANSDTNVSDSDTKMSITPDGVCFGTDTASQNALDDYEEGESTITISPASGSITLKSTHNKCVFTKVGRLVSFNIHIRVDSISSPSGGVSINGLPFACASDEKFRASASVSPVYNFSSPSGSMALAWVGNSSTSMNFAFYNGSTQTLNAGGYFQVNTEAYITGSYMT